MWFSKYFKSKPKEELNQNWSMAAGTSTAITSANIASQTALQASKLQQQQSLAAAAQQQAMQQLQNTYYTIPKSSGISGLGTIAVGGGSTAISSGSAWQYLQGQTISISEWDSSYHKDCVQQTRLYKEYIIYVTVGGDVNVYKDNKLFLKDNKHTTTYEKLCQNIDEKEKNTQFTESFESELVK